MNASILPEDVGHDISEIEQHPLSGCGPLDAQRPFTASRQHPVDVVGDRTSLPIGFRGAEHQIISDGRQRGNVEDLASRAFCRAWPCDSEAVALDVRAIAVLLIQTMLKYIRSRGAATTLPRFSARIRCRMSEAGLDTVESAGTGTGT